MQSSELSTGLKKQSPEDHSHGRETVGSEQQHAKRHEGYDVKLQESIPPKRVVLTHWR
jgi:hypothetical protein